jgi:phosphoglucosamine mutase
MNNLGLEKSLNNMGIAFHRADVGDRNVLKMLMEVNGNLGGEPSGHLIDLDKLTTGDGLLASLQILEIMFRNRLSLNDLSSEMLSLPQVLLNIDSKDSFDPFSSAKINDEFNRLSQELGSTGRIVLRRSGTQNLIRLMVEGEDQAKITETADILAEVILENAK